MRQKYVKCFRFEERNRSRLTFSDPTKIRLNPRTHRLELAVQSYDGVTGRAVYPLDSDLTVTTWVTNPLVVRGWLAFGAEPCQPLLPANTQVRFRLNDGTNDRYWDGGSWAVAGAADWNDELTVAANIATYPVSAKQLGLVINLVTTDKFVTPHVEWVDVLMEVEMDYFHSLSTTLMESFRLGIRPAVDYVMYATGSDRLSLGDMETPYEIVGVQSVYDHTTDADHLTDLFSAYDPSSMVITLTASLPRGNKAWVVFTIEPRVYLNWASQDYIEIEKIPAIVLENFRATGNLVTARMLVKDCSALQATVRDEPFRLQLEFDVVLLAEKNRTLLVMMDRALEHAAVNQVLGWPDLDEQVSLLALDKGMFRPRPALSDKHEASYSMRMVNAYLWLQPEQVKPLIQRVNVTLRSTELQGGVRWTGTKDR